MGSTDFSTDVLPADAGCLLTTVCRMTGRPCREASRLATDFLATFKHVAPFVSPEFEICGTGWLEGCASGCTARYRARLSGVRIFCGVDADVDTALLDDLADATFSDDQAAIGRLGKRSSRDLRLPCLIAESRVRHARAAAMVSSHWPANQSLI